MSTYIKDCPSLLYDAITSCDFSSLDEVVIVCDGPVLDRHISAIKASTPAHLLKLVQLEKNIGLGRALNAGLRECSADYIFRMDADDICVPDRFASQIDYIEKNECDILGGQICEFDKISDTVQLERYVPTDPRKLKLGLLNRNTINHVTVCYNREKIMAIGSYHHALYHEDYDLWIRASRSGLNIVNMDKLLVRVRVGNGFLTRRHGFSYLMNECRFVIKNLTFFKVNAIPYLVVRSFLRLGPKFVLSFVYKKILRVER